MRVARPSVERGSTEASRLYVRLLGVVLIAAAPATALAFSVPFVGSPFAHMTVFFGNDMIRGESQTAAAANATGKPQSAQCKGDHVETKTSGTISVKDSLCYNMTCGVVGGQTDCKYVSICKNADKTCTASCPDNHGFMTYDSFAGTKRRIDPCNAKEVQNLSCLGDSNGLLLCNSGGVQLKDAQCNTDGTDASSVNTAYLACAGRTPNNVAETTKNLPNDSLKGTQTAISMCSNEPSQCDICKTDPNQCPIDQTIQAAKEKGATNVYCEGVSSGGIANGTEYNSIIRQACERNGGTFLGPLQTDTPTAIHASTDGYQQMLGQIGQFESPGVPPATPDNAGSAAFAGQTQCGIEGPAGLLAYAESYCGQNPNTNAKCASGGACGPLQIIPDTYDSYLNEYQNGTGDYSCAGTTAQNADCSVKITNYHVNQWLQSSSGQNCLQILGSQPECVYGQHWMGQGGLNAALGLYQSDPNQPATAICSTVAKNNCSVGNMSLDGLTMSQMFQQLDTRMGIGTGDVVPNLAGGAGSAVPGPTIAGQSPLNDNQIQVVHVSSPSISSGGLGGLGGLGLMGGTNLGNLFGNLFKPSTLNTAQTQQAAPPPPQPTLSLTVQPQVLARGNPFSVSWTSSNMSPTAPCQATQNGAVIGQGNAGAVSVPTSATSTASTIVVRLLCQSASNGQVYQQSANLTLQ